MSAYANEIRDFPLDPAVERALPSRPVTVGQALRLSLDALLKARKWRDADLCRAAGLSSATISKMRSGDRFASVKMLEKIRRALEVAPRDLFDPDAALAKMGLARREPDTAVGAYAQRPMEGIDTSALPSALPLVESGGFPMQHPDPELLSALVAFWDAMTPDQRLECVATARRLKQQPGGLVKEHRG